MMESVFLLKIKLRVYFFSWIIDRTTVNALAYFRIGCLCNGEDGGGPVIILLLGGLGKSLGCLYLFC